MNGVPAYAGEVVNPMLLMAIESTRQHLGKVLPPSWSMTGLPNHPAAKMHAIDDPALLKRWQGDCRAAVLHFQAMQGLGWRLIDKPAQASSDAVPAGKGASLDWLGETSLVAITRPARTVLVKQAKDVVERCKERSQPKSDDLDKRDRIWEIYAQVVPQYAFWSSVLPIHPQRMPRTLELMQLALELAFAVEQRFKHALAVPRPHEINPQVCPAMLTPGHGSLPSGHATEAFTIATLMTAFLGNDAGTGKTLSHLAQRIADNRQVAGLHYAIDTLSGQVLGSVLGAFLVARCRGGDVTPGIFNGPWLKGDEVCREDGEAPTDIAAIRSAAAIHIERDEQLHWLWHEARLEWGAAPDEDKPPRRARPQASAA